MTGKMTIHPAGQTQIQFSMPDDRDVSDVYILSSQDFKESEREKILYSEGRLSGEIIGSEASIVDIILMVIVGGDTHEEIAVSMKTLQSAFSDPNGGYIEYRPVGYADTILPTFYRYLRSSPPERVNESFTYQAPNENKSLGQLFAFTVKIFSLATSDPESLQLIEDYAAIDNFNPGYLTIDDDDIKGDGLFPVIDFGLDPTTGSVIASIVNVHPIDAAASGDDLLVTASGGDYDSYDASGRYQWTSKSSGYIEFETPTTSEKILGRVTPLLPILLGSGSVGQWEGRVLLRMGSTGNWSEMTDWQILISSSSYWDINIFDAIPYPLIQLPKTASDLTDLIGEIRFEFRTRDSNTYNLSLYGAIMSPVNTGCWIAELDYNSAQFLVVTDNTFLVIDSISDMCYMDVKSLGEIRAGWRKKGMPIRDLILPKGTDYQVRISMNDIGFIGYHHTSPIDPVARIRGIFYTIYPFGES